jgi:hypothetical protein
LVFIFNRTKLKGSTNNYGNSCDCKYATTNIQVSQITYIYKVFMTEMKIILFSSLLCILVGIGVIVGGGIGIYYITQLQSALSDFLSPIKSIAILAIVGLMGLGAIFLLIGISTYALRRRTIRLEKKP